MITVLHISLNICLETKLKAIRLVRVGSDLIWHPSFDRDHEVHIEIWFRQKKSHIIYHQKSFLEAPNHLNTRQLNIQFELLLLLLFIIKKVWYSLFIIEKTTFRVLLISFSIFHNMHHIYSSCGPLCPALVWVNDSAE